MRRFYCTIFKEYMLSVETLLGYANLFSLNDYKKNDKIKYKSFKNKMSSLKFRLKKIDETRNYLLEETKHNDLVNEKYKNTFKYLNYVEFFLILASTITGCVLISRFTWLVGVLVGITSSAVRLKVCAITAGIKKYKSIKKKKRKKHDKIVLLRSLEDL